MDAVCRLSDGCAADACRQQVVDAGRRVLAKEFPHQRTAQCKRVGLPEIHAVRACRVEVQVAVIGVCKQVRIEVVVVPHEAPLEVIANAVQRGLRKVLAQHETVEAVYDDVDACHFRCCSPRVRLRIPRWLWCQRGLLLRQAGLQHPCGVRPVACLQPGFEHRLTTRRHAQPYGNHHQPHLLHLCISAILNRKEK
jgi:hypothetical protein